MNSEQSSTSSLESQAAGNLHSADLPELQQARALWVANRLQESLRYYDLAVRRYPDNPIALVEAAIAFGNRFEIGKAEELLSRMPENSLDSRLLMAAGSCYQAIGRLPEAIHCFQRVLAISPAHGEAHVKLSQIFDRINQLESGLHHAEQGLANQPNSSAALLSHSQLLRRSGKLDQAERNLRQLSTTENLPPDVRVSACYQLGYLFDESGRFDEAFESVLQAKQLQQVEAADLSAKSKQEIAILEKLWQSVTRSDFDRWAQESAGLRHEKIAFLVGAPRSGTTLLERVLGAHPDINSTDEEFFLPQVIIPELLNNHDHRVLQRQDLNQIPTGRLKIERDRYFRYLTALMRQDSRAKLHIDKNPSFIRLLPVILKLFPEAKILFAVRDPRDLVVSSFMRQFPLNPISVEFLSLEQTSRAVARDLELWQTLKQQLPDNWLEIRYEDMVVDLESTSRRTFEFLELPWDASVLNFHQLNTPVNSPTYEAVAKPIFQHARGRWLNYEQYLAPVLKILESVSHQFQYT